MPNVSARIPRLLEDDDVEAFLLTSERSPRGQRWPQDDWEGFLAPLLRGKAQAAYYDIEEGAAVDYACLKAEIQSHYQLNPG
jgi:hypothetical protein